MHPQLTAFLLLAASANAYLVNNLNFGSPSKRSGHEGLGIDLPKIVKRTSGGLHARTTLNTSALQFTHGVASGDPYSDSIILWTRISPTFESDRSNVTVEGTVAVYSHETEQYIRASRNRICVEYNVWDSPNATEPVTKGTAATTSDIDYTVKVEAKGLEPFTTYYYQFNVCGTGIKSPLGRTKTAPDEDDDVTNIGIAVYSCSNFPTGYFNAYGNAARKDRVDYVVHLGDYIYEGLAGVAGRDPRASNPQKEIVSLFDYRTRIAQYRTDQDLLLSHQQFPWIPTWDDHEIANNGYRDGFSGMNNTEDSFIRLGRVSVDQRKMNAVRAYFEWMPIRQVDMDDNLRIWRSFKLGKLADLMILDTRNYDRSITTLNYNNDYIFELTNDAGRSLMGGRQENWFYRQLSESFERGATWRIIGNQLVFSRVNISSWFGTFENPYNGDQWDGYQSNRNRTFQHLYDNGIDNNVFLAGDSHANWVSDLVWIGEEAYNQETGEGSVGVEFAGTAVSSSGYGNNVGANLTSGNQQSSTLVRDNAELQWAEGYYRGYFELQISAEEIAANYYGMPTVTFRNPLEIPLANFTVRAGANRLTRPVGGGVVENGVLQRGTRTNSNITFNTETGLWNTTAFEQMIIRYPPRGS